MENLEKNPDGIDENPTDDGIDAPRNINTRHDIKARVIRLNATQEEKFARNGISTAKYSLVSFVPSFLFEQFRRYSNIFFLLIALLQQIPDVSPTGRYTTLVPLICILSVSALKEIVEDVKRHTADLEINNRKVEVLKDGYWQWVKWKLVSVGDFVKVQNDKFFPADLIVYSSSEPQALCYVETSNLDGETNLKIKQGLPETSTLLETKDLSSINGFMECQQPNRYLYEFAGKLKIGSNEDLALGPDQMLLRGSKLQNTKWIFGQVVYTGHETKLMKNSTAAPLKRSTVDKLTNTQILMLFGLLIGVSLTSAIFSHIWSTAYGDLWYIDLKKIDGMEFAYNVLTFVILYNNLIPISLTVTLEVVRFIQAMFINRDLDMYHAESNTPATARTSNLNEELGQVRYVFSDKTGTLTRNVMEFKECTVGKIMYTSDDLFGDTNLLLQNLIANHSSASQIREFLTLLAVCHTVIPERVDDRLIYHAASPDESALVDGASRLGYVFETRTPTDVIIDANGVKEKYEILHLLEFTSTRKRMSVVVKCPDNKIKLYCKGADSVIYERLSKDNPDAIKAITESHLEQFATNGLRTLCCAVTEISSEAYENWRPVYHKAATAIHDREEKLEDASNLIETNLILLGATAIEDKLQDKVPETIAALLQAGISVWVLTGDKQETAINIGYSCRLLNQSMELLIINQDNLDATRECILSYVNILGRDNGQVLPKENDAAVVIDGNSLKYALSHDLRRDFLQLCTSCRSVICCRASPMQKAEIVEYVTQLTGGVTLAIGDGANDVAMIQKAHVGVGISGFEGLQAALASDYAIAQFSYLAKLLLVHGAWNYDRMCKIIFYSFYKNICLYIIELWFAIYSGWSGQIIFERWTIGFYNMFFTSCQPMAMGIFDRNCSKEIRLRFPMLYKPAHNPFGLSIFFLWVGNSILHSVMLFWLSRYLVGEGAVWSNGRDGGYLVLGNFVYTYVVIVVSLKSGLETKSWTVFTHLAIWGSIILWIVFLMAYSQVWKIGLPVGAEIFGIGNFLMVSPMFWIGIVFVPIITLIPDIVFKAVRGTMFKTLDEQFRASEVRNIDPNEFIKYRKSRLNETARLLRNVFRRRPSDQNFDLDLFHGYAFSQEEHGIVTQSQLIRTYDSTIPKPEGM